MQKVPITDPKIKNKMGKTSKLKSLKISKVTIITQKKGMANMFKNDKVTPVKKGFSFLGGLPVSFTFSFLDSVKK